MEVLGTFKPVKEASAEPSGPLEAQVDILQMGAYQKCKTNIILGL